MATVVDKRKAPRFSCLRPQEFSVGSKEQKGKGYLFDLSRDGLAFQSSVSLEREKVYPLEILASVSQKPISCEARIVWAKPQDNNGNYLCGARIIRMAPSDKVDLLDILYQDWKQSAIG